TRPDALARLVDVRGYDAEALTAGAAEWLAYRDQAAALAALRRSRPGGVKAPVVLLEARRYYDPVRRSVLRAAFPAARWVSLPNSRHLVMVDAPERIACAVQLLTRP
ncbi:hypothetical protein, partial [Actinomyces sp. MRS3W]|uniref:alpha/beta fold hydrolase n=1 Tax=Actinomyces sp. MRS3W TaxID=2800796 RepID=UPI0028FD8281